MPDPREPSSPLRWGSAPSTSGGTAAPSRTLTGAFITFEGIDGCGKTTQQRRLVETLRRRGYPLCVTQEPGATAVGRRLRTVLLDPSHSSMSPLLELLLYVGDRIQHLEEVIRPALGRGETVLCDRYHDSTVAYQHWGRRLNFAPIAALIASEIAPTVPDLTLWLDAPPELAAKRRTQRIAEQQSNASRRGSTSRAPGDRISGEWVSNSGRFEQAGDLAAEDAENRLDREPSPFYERVQAGYKALWREEPERIHRIDAANDADTVQAAIWSALAEQFDDL